LVGGTVRGYSKKGGWYKGPQRIRRGWGVNTLKGGKGKGEGNTKSIYELTSKKGRWKCGGLREKKSDKG